MCTAASGIECMSVWVWQSFQSPELLIVVYVLCLFTHEQQQQQKDTVQIDEKVSNM